MLKFPLHGFMNVLFFFTPLFKADRCSDRIPIHFQDTFMSVDRITRQSYHYATTITCDNSPRNKSEFDPDLDDQNFYILKPEPINGKSPLMCTPSQSKTTIRANTFTAQDATICYIAEHDHFSNRVLFSKLSDTILQKL